MTAQEPNRIDIRTVDNHVEIYGLSQDEVEHAIKLYQAVKQRQLEARAALEVHVNQKFNERALKLISEVDQLPRIRKDVPVGDA